MRTHLPTCSPVSDQYVLCFFQNIYRYCSTSVMTVTLHITTDRTSLSFLCSIIYTPSAKADDFPFVTTSSLIFISSKTTCVSFPLHILLVSRVLYDSGYSHNWQYFAFSFFFCLHKHGTVSSPYYGTRFLLYQMI